MTEWLKGAWHWLTTTRYTRSLEAEVERLRAENLALRESLGVPGFAQGTPRLRYREHLPALGGSASGGKTEAGGTPAVRKSEAPKAIRRPSVRQVLARAEIEAAREAERLKRAESA